MLWGVAKQDGVQQRLQGFIAGISSEQFIQDRFVDIREKAGDVELDDIG